MTKKKGIESLAIEDSDLNIGILLSRRKKKKSKAKAKDYIKSQ